MTDQSKYLKEAAERLRRQGRPITATLLDNAAYILDYPDDPIFKVSLKGKQQDPEPDKGKDGV